MGHIARIGLALALIGAASPASACSVNATCDDVIASLYGHVVVDTVAIDWSTDDEYEVTLFKTWRCTDSTCAQFDELVSAQAATGSCSTGGDYAATDANGESGDTYLVALIDGLNNELCTARVSVTE